MARVRCRMFRPLMSQHSVVSGKGFVTDITRCGRHDECKGNEARVNNGSFYNGKPLLSLPRCKGM